jgi:tape measure domain-containing protein
VAENLQFNLEVDNSKAIQSIDEFFNKFQNGAKEARAQLDQSLGTKGKIEVVVDVKNKKAADDVKKINDEAKKVKENMALANSELGKTAAQVKKQISALRSLRDNTEKYVGSTGKVNAKWKEHNSKLQIAKSQLAKLNYEGPFNTLKNAIGGVIGKFTLVQTLANLFTAAIQQIGQAIGAMVSNAIEMEVLDLQLKAFTGSAAGAAQAFAAFGQTAAATPFDLKQVVQAGKTMMAFGMSTADSTEMTDRLAIAAAATGGELNNLGRNLGQIQAQGRAYTRDLTQFAMQGIPIWAELSTVTGKSVVELKAMAKDGKIGFDEVSQAIRNMTDEGSAFQRIAEEMGDTIAGKMARIQQANDKAALSFAKAVQNIEKAIPIIKTTLDQIENLINFLANNMEDILILIGAVVLAVGGLAVAFNFSAIMAGLGMVASAIGALLGPIMAISGPLLLLGGVAIVGAFALLKGAIEGAKRAAEQKAEADFLALSAAERLTDGELKKAAQLRTNIGVAANYALAMREIAEASRETLDEEIQKLQEIAGERQAAHEAEMDRLDEQIDAKQSAIDKEKSDHQDLVKQKEQAHRDEMDRIRNEYDAKMELIDEEIAKLQEKTPSEQKLYDLRKKELQDKIKSGELDEEELLRAKARLERMLQNEKIQEKRLEKKKLEKEEDKEITAEQKKHQAQMDALNTAHDARIKKMEAQLDSLKNQKTQAENTFQKEQDEINDVIKMAQNQKTAFDNSTDALRDQIQVVKDLTIQTKALEDQARKAANEMNRIANKEVESRANSSSSSGSTQSRSDQSQMSGAFKASGGPVTGGSTYTVNELGKEAFLSAQGRLSMINAPSWGQWTAPGKGTVIPAHLASQLNVPTGGINLNKAASGNAMMANASQGAGSIVRAIKSAAMGGDNITNNVTVQSDNTTKTASDMLVSMTRLRRRRYS